ncbi:MAG: division/cell wall cluster transcriptional repressor MraZ [Candidatus Eisenbacteria bacterium]|nr:division/cell wall cluster transcriptional repressor MraZ [Candidatus Eisenbacteria bacterium]
MGRLLGRYQATLDEKGRTNIPARIRRVLSPDPESPIIITRGYDDCLAVYPLAEWEAVEKDLRALPYNVGNTRLFAREMASHAVEAGLDRSGRILIPREHREWAHLEKDILVLGVITHLELFNPEIYERYRSGYGMTYEGVAEEMQKYRSTGRQE